MGGVIKLIIQIPCYNESQSLPVTLAELPRSLSGFDCVEWLIIDDGSSDGTAQKAKELKADHVMRLSHGGLARAFSAGIKHAVDLGADVIVNTDADNQYQAKDIEKLVAPLLQGKADIAIGARPISAIKSFSPAKKLLQRLGSWVVRAITGADVKDATSGFRAFSRDAALNLNVFDSYTYTLETIIQAANKNMSIMSVDIAVNNPLRESRLITSVPAYVFRSAVTIIRMFIVYRPFRFFFFTGIVIFLGGMAIGLRFLHFYLNGNGSGHVQSLILASILVGMGFQTVIIALLADLFAINRKLLENIQYRLGRK